MCWRRPATQAAEEYKLSSSMGGMGGKGSGAGMHDMMELFMQMLMAGQAGGRLAHSAPLPSALMSLQRPRGKLREASACE